MHENTVKNAKYPMSEYSIFKSRKLDLKSIDFHPISLCYEKSLILIFRKININIVANKMIKSKITEIH